jgi:hypothetical protein
MKKTKKTIRKPDDPSGARATSARKPRKRGTWKEVFLAELRKYGILGDACRAARVSWDTIDKYRSEDAEFAARYSEALEEAVDRVEKQAMKIAGEGIRRPIYRKGELVGYQMEPEPGMIQFVLRTRRRDRYADKLEVNHSGAVGHVHATAEQLAAAVAEKAPLLQALGMQVLGVPLLGMPPSSPPSENSQS